MKPILTGIGVSRGQAQGRVKLIRSREDREQFRAGDILVTQITDPTMVALMAKASAIVCDIGSITSHPSIVSRELGIPCVVNTKIGTSVLADGMDIVVDGTTGGIFLAEEKIKPEQKVETVSDNLDSDINEFVETMANACCAMDFRTFTMNGVWFAYDPLIAKGWTDRILRMIRNCEIERLTSMEIGRLFPNMSDMRNKMLFDLWMAKYAGISAVERKKIFVFYNDILRTVCVDDPYAKRRNAIHSKEKVWKLAAITQPADPHMAKKLGRLVSACYHAGHALFSDMNPCNVYDNFGPYDVSNLYGDGYMLVLKQFTNLRPAELWPAVHLDVIGCDRIAIICVYENVRMSVDAISHVVYDGDTIGGLRRAVLLLDGRPFSINKIDSVIDAIETLTTEAFEHCQTMDVEERKKFYYHQKAYGYKEIHRRLGQSWQPSQAILAEAAGKALCQIDWTENSLEQKKLFKKILDPRIDFKP